jgi:uncharacterized protein YecT (DUF1311 family)
MPDQNSWTLADFSFLNQHRAPAYACGMKILTVLLFMAVVLSCAAQTDQQDVSPSQLKALLDLPIEQAVQKRNLYKAPLKVAYARQSSLAGKDCVSEADHGQQPFNICIGQAYEQAHKDYATFYNNLQMLCHSQDELIALQMSEASWMSYRENAMKAAQVTWSDGTASSGVVGRVYLSLVRDRMNELYETYDLNISH